MNRTLTILKPDCVAKKQVGKVIDRILEAGFEIKAMKMIRMTRAVAEEFYAVHKNREFFPELVDFMTEGPCLVAVLEKENAVEAYRQLMGATDPAKAEPGTLRKEFAENVSRNVVHGADSEDNARREIGFFFSERELILNS